MADNKSQDARSRNMAAIKGKDTKPELFLRSALFCKGLRYRKNVKSLPGCPDMWLAKYHTAIFVNGCFWHRHKDCKYAYMPKSRTEFWMTKFEKNEKRDTEVRERLKENNIRVLTVWECTIRKMQSSENDKENTLNDIIRFLNSDRSEIEL